MSLAADVVSGVLALRACQNTLAILADVASRERILFLTRRRRAGFATAADEARALTGLASAHTEWNSQQEQCAPQTNVLVELAGEPIATVQALTTPADGTDPVQALMPAVLAARAELPADVLLRHPAILSAEREAQAAWAEIGVAQTERPPRLGIESCSPGLRMVGFGQHLTT